MQATLLAPGDIIVNVVSILQKTHKFRKEYRQAHRQRYGVLHAMLTKRIGIFKWKSLIR